MLFYFHLQSSVFTASFQIYNPYQILTYNQFIPFHTINKLPINSKLSHKYIHKGWSRPRHLMNIKPNINQPSINNASYTIKCNLELIQFKIISLYTHLLIMPPLPWMLCTWSTLLHPRSNRLLVGWFAEFVTFDRCLIISQALPMSCYALKAPFLPITLPNPSVLSTVFNPLFPEFIHLLTAMPAATFSYPLQTCSKHWSMAI